jgi:DNA-binding NarL/FixJ family response regulator
MIERGITRQDSPEGIELCLNCPLPKCELDIENASRISYRNRIIAVGLARNGVSIEEIANRLGKSIRQVKRYIKSGY